MAQQTAATISYFPVRLDTIRPNSLVDFELYVQNGGNYVLYRGASQQFLEKNRQALLEAGVSRLYIHRDNQSAYHRYLEHHLRDIIHDPGLNSDAKAGIVYDTAKLLVTDVLNNPCLGENVRRGRQMVETTVQYILLNDEAFYSLLQVMSFDYYLYTHSVNVCTLALTLGRHVGIDNETDLADLGTGALLHDVGKTKVPEQVLNKPGPLSPDEIDIVRLHPEWGCQMLRESGQASEMVCVPVRQHHERMNGGGYPDGLVGEQIHRYSRMVAIADAFDAMTTQRVYRSAAGAFTALETMYGESGAFDRELLVQFTMMLGPANLTHL